METDQKKYQCPICSDKIIVNDNVFDKYFPFCCKRCQLIDLGQWAASSYRVPGTQVSEIEEEDLEK